MSIATALNYGIALVEGRPGGARDILAGTSLDEVRAVGDAGRRLLRAVDLAMRRAVYDELQDLARESMRMQADEASSRIGSNDPEQVRAFLSGVGSVEELIDSRMVSVQSGIRTVEHT